ncbi:hypothetical protein [Nocardia gipuzkoensis]|uniref:hypothetical protein n=1 Tax=Nocardia gipuzkoensis TaxID=2749991 RepID=UPI003EE14B62
MSLYENVRSVAFTARSADRYTKPSPSAAPEVERLRHELYHYPAADPTPARP